MHQFTTGEVQGIRAIRREDRPAPSIDDPPGAIEPITGTAGHELEANFLHAIIAAIVAAGRYSYRYRLRHGERFELFVEFWQKGLRAQQANSEELLHDRRCKFSDELSQHVVSTFKFLVVGSFWCYAVAYWGQWNPNDRWLCWTGDECETSGGAKKILVERIHSQSSTTAYDYRQTPCCLHHRR